MQKKTDSNATEDTHASPDNAQFPEIEALLDRMGSPEAPEVKQTYGVVTSEGDSALVVRVGAHSVTAKRAASCLLEPRVGDEVLVAVTDRDHSFVLAVLVQGPREHQGGTLSIDGDLTLRAKTGKISLVANDTVSLTSGTEVAVTAPSMAVRALKTSIFSESLAYVGRRIEAEAQKVKLVAEVLDSVVDRVSARLKRSYRTVEELEHVKAKELDVVVEGNISIHSENTIVSADKLVKLDGEQVHLG